MDPGGPELLQEGQGLPVLLLRLRGQAGDDVGGEGEAGDEVVGPLHQLPVVGLVVAAAHELEEPVRARLQGKVEVGPDLGGVAADHLKEVLPRVLGLYGGKPHLGPQVVEVLHEPGKAPGVPLVAPEAHPGEDDLLDAHPEEGLGLGQGLPVVPVALLAPKPRDDAVGATRLAPVLDLEEGPHPAV